MPQHSAQAEQCGARCGSRSFPRRGCNHSCDWPSKQCRQWPSIVDGACVRVATGAHLYGHVAGSCHTQRATVHRPSAKAIHAGTHVSTAAGACVCHAYGAVHAGQWRPRAVAPPRSALYTDFIFARGSFVHVLTQHFRRRAPRCRRCGYGSAPGQRSRFRPCGAAQPAPPTPLRWLRRARPAAHAGGLSVGWAPRGRRARAARAERSASAGCGCAGGWRQVRLRHTGRKIQIASEPCTQCTPPVLRRWLGMSRHAGSSVAAGGAVVGCGAQSDRILPGVWLCFPETLPNN